MSTRDGDPFLNSKLNLLLRKSLTELQFKEQQTYLENATYATHFALNKLHRQHRINFKVNLQSISKETGYNFSQGSTSSGLAYGLATFIAYWQTLLGNKTTLNPIFATGEIDKQGKVSPIDFLRQKIEFICKYASNQHDFSVFTVCIPEGNKHELSDTQIALIKNAGGHIIVGNELGDFLEQLLPEEYIKDPGRTLTPFKVNGAYEIEDSLGFFGRDREAIELKQKIEQNNGIAILSGSKKSGRTSLIQAGLNPLLKKEHQHAIFVIFSINDIEEDSEMFDLFFKCFLKQIRQVCTDDAAYHKIENTLLEKGTEQYHLANQLLNNLGQHLYFNIEDTDNLFSLDKYQGNIEQLLSAVKALTCLNIIFTIKDENLNELLQLEVVELESVISIYPPNSVDTWQEIITNKALFFNFEIESSLQNEIIKSAVVQGKESLVVINYLLDMFYQRAKKEDQDTICLKYLGNEKETGISGVVIKIIDTALDDKPQEVVDSFFLEILTLDANGKIIIKDSSENSIYMLETTKGFYPGGEIDKKNIAKDKVRSARLLLKLLPLIDIEKWHRANEFFTIFRRFLEIRKQIDPYYVRFWDLNCGDKQLPLLDSGVTYQIFELAKVRRTLENANTNTDAKELGRFATALNQDETFFHFIQRWFFEDKSYLAIPFSIQIKYVLANIHHTFNGQVSVTPHYFKLFLWLARKRVQNIINVVIGAILIVFIVGKIIS